MTLSLTAAQIALFHAQVGNMLAAANRLLSQMSDWGSQIGALTLVSSPPSGGYFTSRVTESANLLVKPGDACVF